MTMPPVSEPLSTSILAIMYIGDVVFAVSGALNVAWHRMDILGYVLIGTITGLGDESNSPILKLSKRLFTNELTSCKRNNPQPLNR